MDDKTKERAHEKHEAMDQFIAYGDEFLDRKIVDEFFINVEISKTDFFENSLTLNKFWRLFKYNQFREPINPKSWLEHTGVSAVNAHYNGGSNNIKFPAGILQGVFFNANIPNYMNFGSIGSIIGHEVTHGFDDKGKQRNGKGITTLMLNYES